MKSPTTRRMAAVFALTLALSGCGQGGSPEAANQAVDDFLTALVQRDVNEAWSHLSPDTRERVYDNDQAEFGREVNDADWSELSWEFGPVVNFDNAWEIHFLVDDGTVPDFLIERRIALMSEPWLVMVVQTPTFQPYLIWAEDP